MKTNQERIEKLRADRMLDREDFRALLTGLSPEEEALLYKEARSVREEIYGKEVYLRGLVEFSSYCRNDCYYCGLRRSNPACQRYRLTKEEILDCAKKGYDLGFRTIVLQSRESYFRYFEAGAYRYLLRHETASGEHYALLHPPELSCENRKRCLRDLKEIGYQTGCGIMVGSPGQTTDHLIEDLFFMKEFSPQMIGIGPFIPHKDTPFRDRKGGSLEDTLHLLAIIRLMLPYVLLPATTALGTIDPWGREKGLLAGANVVMPNLSPVSVRGKYMLYDGKICTGEEAAECRSCLERRIEQTGYRTVVSRGDCRGADSGLIFP